MAGAQSSQGYGHPYVPEDLRLPGFVPDFLSMSIILESMEGLHSLSPSCGFFQVIYFEWMLSKS